MTEYFNGIPVKVTDSTTEEMREDETPEEFIKRISNPTEK